MLKRTLAKKLKEAAKQYPVVTLTGPRQSGKTTLVKITFPDHDYITLEEPDHQLPEPFAQFSAQPFLQLLLLLSAIRQFGYAILCMGVKP